MINLGVFTGQTLLMIDQIQFFMMSVGYFHDVLHKLLSAVNVACVSPLPSVVSQMVSLRVREDIPVFGEVVTLLKYQASSEYGSRRSCGRGSLDLNR
jgi:hypothetical protein